MNGGNVQLLVKSQTLLYSHTDLFLIDYIWQAKTIELLKGKFLLHYKTGVFQLIVLVSRPSTSLFALWFTPTTHTSWL